MILLSQTDWQALAAAATYSASQVDNATIDCFFDDHKQTVFSIIKQWPLVLFLSSESPPQSLSEYLTISIFLDEE